MSVAVFSADFLLRSLPPSCIYTIEILMFPKSNNSGLSLINFLIVSPAGQEG
jgi:hypothetical protein